nr:PAS domain S-box protein [Nitrospirota bacterium]
MVAKADPRHVVMLRSLSRASSAAVSLAGVLVLLGWMFDVATLKSVGPDLATMKPNTATAFVLAGAALWLLRWERDDRRGYRLAKGCAFAVALIGLLTLSEHLVGWDPGIDRLLFTKSVEALGASTAGRMSSATALMFTLLGSSLLLLDVKTHAGYFPSQFFVLPAGFLSLLSFLGYAYNVKALYTVGPFASIALHTTVLFVLLCLGILCARPDRCLMAVVTRDSPGGFMARRLLPAVFLLPVALGWLRLKGQEAGLYGTEFGVALLVMISIAFFMALIWVAAQSVDRMETHRRRAEKMFRDLYEFAPDAMVSVNGDGEIVAINSRTEKVFGYERGELLFKPLDVLIPERFRSRHRQHIAYFFSHPHVRPMGAGLELWGRRNGGGEFPLEISLSPIETEEGLLVTAAIRDITKRREVEQALAKNEEFLRTIIEAEPECVKLVDRHGTVLKMNQAGLAMLQADAPEQVIGRPARQFVAPEHHRAFEECADAVFRGESRTLEFEMISLKGARLWLDMHAVPLRNDGSETVTLLGVTRDITGRKQAEASLREREEQLRQAQKMEAVGQLAGGIAHDFNNMLTVINGYSDMLLQALPADDTQRDSVTEIRQAGERAASLTRQLLAFSRRQVLELRVLDLNAVVASVDTMLRRLIGEDIELVTVLKSGLGHVKADPGQLEQVIMNLIVNARDAMPQGGKLTIETGNVDLDETYAGQRFFVLTGPYVMLAVSDTGCGMDAETQKHIFEPFFTTKEKGKGTGLGLATVYGIVKQSGGYIWVYSEEGKGTAFKVYLPRIPDAPASAGHKAQPSRSVLGSETILLVEDDALVRTLTMKMLESGGYTVLAAPNGDDAIRIFRTHPNPIHLIVSDVVMPFVSGREMAASLVALNPDVKVLFMSGYTDDTIVRHGVVEMGVPFIQKPFTPTGLLRKIREVLES